MRIHFSACARRAAVCGLAAAAVALPVPSAANADAMPGMSANEHAGMTGGAMPGMSAEQHAHMAPSDTARRESPPTGRPVGLLLGGFALLNGSVLLYAAVARRRPDAVKRRDTLARVRGAAGKRTVVPIAIPSERS